MNNENRLNDIIDYVTRRTGANILDKSREVDVTNARALYYKIALRKTRASMNAIGAAVGKSHSTVIHTRVNVFNLIEEDDFYMNIYRDFFGETIVEDVLRPVDNEILTKNEKDYRNLSNEDKAIYDERATLVLKSFEWKRKDDNRKEVFEIININQ